MGAFQLMKQMSLSIPDIRFSDRVKIVQSARRISEEAKAEADLGFRLNVTVLTTGKIWCYVHVGLFQRLFCFIVRVVNNAVFAVLIWRNAGFSLAAQNINYHLCWTPDVRCLYHTPLLYLSYTIAFGFYIPLLACSHRLASSFYQWLTSFIVSAAFLSVQIYTPLFSHKKPSLSLLLHLPFSSLHTLGRFYTWPTVLAFIYREDFYLVMVFFFYLSPAIGLSEFFTVVIFLNF